ncbi:PKD domain-containing protein [Petrimonas sp.]|uniref:PKD domain-containing protein n=1 Tax=Petrimonas sp. TaxID=2023866 RepID=UPI003F511682
MKKITNILLIVSLYCLWSCEPQTDPLGKMGPAPLNPTLTVDAKDPYNPVFKASADNGYIYHWDMGNGQFMKPGANSVTAYYPFTGSYNVKVTIFGEGAQSTSAETTFTVATTDPTITTKPVWKELTGSGKGRTWVYNTDPATGSPDYSYQTTDDLVSEPDGWMPSSSWGQCVQITPDINGEMVFDLNEGINYTYHHVAGDTGVKGTFVLDTEKMTITIKNPYILDYNIECTSPAVTSTGVYQIKKLTDDEMVLWQNQQDGTGWSWSFKSKK